MRDRYGAQDERSWKLRTHAQTAGCSLTWQQPYNNIVRTTLQALAAVLGGTQSLHTNSLDEAYALPSEHAVTIALRTQQVIAYESGVSGRARSAGRQLLRREPHGRDGEAAPAITSARIDEMGGMIPAIERGFPQTEIANASYEYQHAIETGEQKIVGVNAFVEQNEEPIEVLQIDESAQRHQLEKLAKLEIAARQRRSVQKRLDALRARGRGPRKHHAASFWTPSAPTPRWAKSAMRSATSSAATLKPASCSDRRSFAAKNMLT